MKRMKGVAEILLEEKLITEEQLKDLEREQRERGGVIQEIAVRKGLVTEEALIKVLAKQIEVPYVTLGDKEIDPQVANMISVDDAHRFKAIPIKIDGNTLQVAFTFPLDLPAINELRLLTGFTIRPVLATEKEIESAINRYFKVGEISRQTLIDMHVEKLKEKKEEKEKTTETKEEKAAKAEEVPIVKLLNDTIQEAINKTASDIHIEPQDYETIIRYRIDGILYDMIRVPKEVALAVISRVKILANMDIAEHRRPQDGHISIKANLKDYDIRVSTVLTINGEKVVMRILERTSLSFSLEKLGLTESDKNIFQSLFAKPYGMILVTGPTGSGKTTSLYTALSKLDSKGKNIITVEEPVEYRIDRVNQIQVDHAIDLTFATGLRTILRQDPNIVMVGEIRDRETAEISVQAALTGHLVLSTLHTNDAPSAITRLIDMGIEPFLISSTVIGVMAQRLCRVICPSCKSEYRPDKEELEFLRGIIPDVRDDIKLAKGKGCEICYQTGFKGREAIFEIMRVSENLCRLIVDRRSASEIKKQAVQEGMRTLQQNGVQKILDKISTIEEVKRVIFIQ